MDDLIIPRCELMDKYMELYNSGGETPLHVAARIGSKQKMDMLVMHGGDLNAKWIGDSVNDTLEKYSVLHKTCENCRFESYIERVKMCREFTRKTETKDIFSAVCGVVYQITEQSSRQFNVNIECILTGSVSENTKCFFPDEFDFLLKVELPRETLCYFSQSVYLLIDAFFKFKEPCTLSEDQRLKSMSFLLETKISKLHFKWTGSEFKNMDILIDVSVCSGKKLAKFSRYEKCERFRRHLPEINLKEDESRKKSIKSNVKQGYILAKTVRCVVYEHPDIHPTTNIDDLITSFLLKSFILEDIKGTLNDLQPCDVAIQIYHFLAEKIKDKEMRTLFPGEEVFSCTVCDGKQGCCKKLKFMSVVVDLILKWLHENMDKLHDIDFASDVQMFEGESFKKTFSVCEDSAENELSFVKFCNVGKNSVVQKV